MNALDSRTTEWRRAEIPAGNGHGNARSVAKVQTLIANGGSAFGKRILSKAGCDRVFDEQSNGMDLVLGTPVRFGMGYGLTSPAFPLGPNPHTVFLGRLGRLAGDRRCRRARVPCLRHEQDGRRHHRRSTRRQTALAAAFQSLA